MPRPRGYTLFVDADDTLWESNIYFDAVVAEYVGMVAAHGRAPGEAHSRLMDIERVRTKRFGYGIGNFQSSIELACQELLEGRDWSSEAGRIKELCTGLRRRAPPMLPGVADTLRALAGRHRIVLFTKGNSDDQLAKVARSGLRGLMHQVDVVAEKDADTYADALRRHGADGRRTWMIGNSPKSDVIPALETGMGAVFIPHHATWMLERCDLPDPAHPRLLIVERFADLTDHF
jgi:putative hydrolase of the HAD superfamily